MRDQEKINNGSSSFRHVIYSDGLTEKETGEQNLQSRSKESEGDAQSESMQMAYTAGKTRSLRRKRVREERFIGKRSKLHTRR